MLSETFIPCASRKYHIHNIWGIGSSTPTSFTSFELFVFSFCLFEAEYRVPRPIVIIPPVWLFMSWCTANSVSTNHFNVLVPSDSKASTRSLVPLRYFSMRNNFLLLYFSRSLTRVMGKATPVRMSGRARLHRKRNFTTMVCNAWASFSLNLREVSLTLKRWFATGVIYMP